MQYADQALLPPSRVIVLDSFPGTIPESQEKGTRSSFESISVPEMISILSQVTLPVSSRSWLKEHLLQRNFPLPLAIWMTTNLRPMDPSGFCWKFNLSALPEVCQQSLVRMNSHLEATYSCMSHTNHSPCGLSFRILRKAVTSTL